MTPNDTQSKGQPMSVPQHEQTPLGKRLTKIVRQRNEAEKNRVFGYVLTAYPHLKDVFPSLSAAKSGSPEITSFIKTMRMLLAQLTGKENIFNKRVNARQVRDHLAEIFTCPYQFEGKFWSIRPNASELALSDEQNIIQGDGTLRIVGDGELTVIRLLISDMLAMVGQLARRIHSCEMNLVLRTIVATHMKPWYGENLQPDEAGKLADDVVYCYEAIRSEIRLMSPAERATLVYPKKPRHRPDITIDANPPPDLSPEEKTKFCRDIAYNQFKTKNIHLLPFIDFFCKDFDSVSLAEEHTELMAKSYKDKKPTLDKGEDTFDYKTLGEVLSADFRLYYDRYYIDTDFDVERQQDIEFENKDDFVEDTPQQKSKEKIIANLREILDAAIKLSAECGSKAGDDWAAAQVTFERRNGDFHSYSYEDDDAAEAELEDFLTAFRRGRQRLWADWMRHCRDDIEEKATPTEPKGPAMDKIIASEESIDANTAIIALNTTPKSEPRDRVIALVRRVNKKIFKGKSIPKAVNYVRFEDKVEDEFVELVEEARQFAISFSNSPSSKTKDEESFWAGIAKAAQPKAAKSAAKRKLKKNADPSAPHGPVPTINGDTGGGLY